MMLNFGVKMLQPHLHTSSLVSILRFSKKKTTWCIFFPEAPILKLFAFLIHHSGCVRKPFFCPMKAISDHLIFANHKKAYGARGYEAKLVNGMLNVTGVNASSVMCTLFRRKTN
jgi:hypothetical protein